MNNIMNNILLGLFFLILGLLFANMLTNICGCKDLVEGQCESNNCIWNVSGKSASNVSCDSIIYKSSGNDNHSDSRDDLCNESNYHSFQLQGSTQTLNPTDFSGVDYWKQTECCINAPVSSTLPKFPRTAANESNNSMMPKSNSPPKNAVPLPKSKNNNTHRPPLKEGSVGGSNSNDCNFKSGSRWTLTAIKDEMFAFNNGLKCLFNHSLPYKLGAADYNIVAIFE